MKKVIAAVILVLVMNLSFDSCIATRDTTKINKVELLGHGKVDFTRNADALIVTLPDNPLNNIMPVLRIKK